jgi:hypothetical protein
MKKVRLLTINLQEGLLLIDGIHIAGGYQHHQQKVIINLPYRQGDFELPEGLKDYEVISGQTDSMGLRYWTSDGWKDAHEITSVNQKTNA